MVPSQGAQGGDCLRVADVDGVRAVDLARVRVHAVCLEPLEVGRHRLVLPGHEVPARDGLPGRLDGERAREGRSAEGSLGRGEVSGDARGQVGGEPGAELRRVQVNVGSLRPVWLGHLDRDERHRRDRVRDRCVDQITEDLAAIRGERGEVDERLDVGVAAGGLRDHGAAVGVTDNDLGALDAVEEAADGRGVELQAEQRVRCGADGVAVAAQPVDDRVEARRVGERAVHEHDRRLGAAEWPLAVDPGVVTRASALAAKPNAARETVASATVASAPRRWRRERVDMVLVLLWWWWCVGYRAACGAVRLRCAQSRYSTAPSAM
jgi:hypothetical protein